MKKIILLLIALTFNFSLVNSNFESDSVYNFINSPSYGDLKDIKDPLIKFCEESYLDAYMRREFSDLENLVCSDFFAVKMEQELIYKKKVLGDRFIY